MEQVEHTVVCSVGAIVVGLVLFSGVCAAAVWAAGKIAKVMNR
jgi:hypothetical protein